MEYKKSAVDLTDLAIGIIVLGIVVSVGATLLGTYQSARLTDVAVATTTNETMIASNNTAVDLSNSWFKDIVSVVNTTGGETLATGNYSTTTDAFGVGSVLFSGTSLYNGTNVSVTYRWYNTSQPDYAVAADASTGIAEFGNWFKILVIVGVAAVVLSLIFMAFGGRGQGSGSVSY